MTTQPEATAVSQQPSSEVVYVDIVGQRQPTTWDDVQTSVKRIRAYFQAITRRFMERDLVIKQLMHAMMMREHVLIDGPSGTAKSHLLRTVFSGIEGANIWAMDLTQFTTDTHLFGSYDVRQMKETGQMVHITTGSIAEANFAHIGEFFDANDAALRALLGVLNERVVKKGAQLLNIPLLSAVADTNFHPESLPTNRRNKLAAVIDRFLFRVPVEYVVEPRNRLAMLEVTLDSSMNAPLPSVSTHDFILVSGLVRGMNLINDPYVVQAYEELTRLYSQERVKAKGEAISDRRFVRAAQIMEISALLNGRREVTFEDLNSTRYVLAHSPTDDEQFDRTLKNILAGWVKRASRREIESELHNLTQITDNIPDAPNLDAMPLTELQRLAAQILQVNAELQAFKSTSIEVGKQQVEKTRSLFALRNNVDLQIIRVIAKSLPEVPEDPPVDQLTILMSQVNSVNEALGQIIPRSDTVLIEHTRVFENVIAAQANLRIAFDSAQHMEINPTTEESGG